MNLPATFPLDATRATQDTERPQFQTYDEYAKIFKQLIQNFDSGEKEKCRVRREFRRHHVNVNEARTRRQLLPDETIVPDRTIEANIRRDKSPLIKYLVQPTVVLSFTDALYPGKNFSPLANHYTDLNRTTGWQHEWFYLIDAIEVHGAGYLEVFFDDTSEIKTSIEYVRRDHLIFPQGARSLDACGHVLRRYEITKQQFDEMAAAKEFDPKQAAKISEFYKNRDVFVVIHRVLMFLNGIVNVAWIASTDTVTDDWLKAPEPYDIGLRKEISPAQPATPFTPEIPAQFGPAELTSYPIIVFPLDLEEDEEILKTQGRVSLDLHVQDALTAIISSVVNGSTRAAGLYPTRKKNDLDDPPAKNQESFVFRHGHIVDGDFTFGKLEWPSAVALSIAQFLRTQNASQSGGIDWAAMNRADTAKTATELTLAQQESDALRSMSTTLFALCALRVELLRWQVYLSQMRAKLVPTPAFCKPELAQLNPAAFIDIFSPSLVPTMAADQQVVRRAEQTTRFMQYWPFVGQTPYGLPFLETMLEDAFPQQFPQWKAAVGSAQQAQAQSQQSLALLQHAFSVLRSMSPEAIPQGQQDDFVTFLNNLGAYLQQNDPEQQSGNNQQAQPQLTN